jgi:tRNA pseudouridine38-40 synthase
VEGLLAGALETAIGRPTDLSVAGRTDAGVHAWGQVASFPAERLVERPGIEGERLAAALNGLLPDDVAVLSAETVNGSFDARRDARSRTYCYRVLARRVRSAFERGRSLWWPRPLDEAAVSACAARLPGTRDFTAFTPTQTDHVRFERDVEHAEWRRNGDVHEFWIEADTFMRHMVRVLVGTMLEVSAGRRSPENFGRLLDGAPRSAAGPTAEPHGLYLASVRYDAVSERERGLSNMRLP